MLHGGDALLVIELCMLVYCTVDVITTPASEVRNLPKLLWLALVVLFPVLGGIAWLVAGRPRGPRPPLPYEGDAGIPPESDRLGRVVVASPDGEEAFLRGLRERAEQQRRAAEQQRAQQENDAG